MIVLSIIVAIMAVACILMFLEGRKMNKKLERTRNEILAEFEGNNPYGVPLQEDEEYWKLLTHDTAAEVLKTYFASGDSGLPDEKELTRNILRYVDSLINELRNRP